MCFEILGMDILIDYKFKPWILEVNHTPSFASNSPFDYKLKFNLIRDTIILMNFNENQRFNFNIKYVIYQL